MRHATRSEVEARLAEFDAAAEAGRSGLDAHWTRSVLAYLVEVRTERDRLAARVAELERAMAIPCESCARLEAEAGRALAEALTAAREDPGLYRLGQDQATAWEHGSAVARKRAESDAEAIHVRIDAALAAWDRAAVEGGGTK